MKKIIIEGNKKLSGTINISGAKNSVVALIPASILTDGKVKILNVPRLSDTANLEKIITLLNGKIEFSPGELEIDSKNLKNNTIPNELATKLRASYYFMGALLARFRHAEICFPGGCVIGSRPIDLHLKAFKKMGVKIEEKNDKYILDAPNLHGADIELDFPSVGATVNILLASSMADGITTIHNAAMEPEIGNLIDLLNNMGAKITGKDTKTIIIEGVPKLHSATIKTISDRIEAGTYMIIGSLIGENLEINNIDKENVESLFEIFDRVGVKYHYENNKVILNKSDDLLSTSIKTEVFPGFPTDLGQPIAVLLMQSKGISNFEETIYENRIGHYPELIKMGANIEYTNSSSKISGPVKLSGCEVKASDLRAGAALIIAGLIADGQTKISNIEHILRGYEDIVNKLTSVGAKISITEE